MTDKIGRNNTCPCGSGKKYKKCCLHKSSFNAEVADLALCKMHQTADRVINDHLTPYSAQELPDDIISTALSDFLPNELPEAMDKALLFDGLFLPWLLFNWIPYDDFGLDKFDGEKNLALNYVSIHGDKLNNAERHFIAAMSETCYSFYSILEVEFEKQLIVKDILLGTTHIIKEQQGTHNLKRGHIILSHILTLDKQSILVGTAPLLFDKYHVTI